MTLQFVNGYAKEHYNVFILVAFRNRMKYYDSISRSYNELHGEEQLNKLRMIKETVGIKQQDILLDVGCGTGLSAVLGGQIMGVDQSFELLKQAKFPVVQGVAEFLPFKKNVFDLVISVSAIHHFDVEKSVKEIKQVGKNTFVISVLKKAKKKEEIITLIKRIFKKSKTVEEEKDSVLFLTNGNS